MKQEAFDLAGKRILVVDEDHAFASSLCRELRTLGATVLGPAPTAFYAMQLIGEPGRRHIHAAVLEVHLHGTTVYELAGMLQDRWVPFVFATATDPKTIPNRFAGEPLLAKPVTEDEVIASVALLVAKPMARIPEPPRHQIFNSSEPPVIHFARAIARRLRADKI